MTSTQARHTRRAVLQSALDTGARCFGADPDNWFRADREPYIEWQARRAEAVRFCAGCPVKAACEELALRNGDGDADADDLVRGGRTGQELAAMRAAQAESLAAAGDADQDTEQRELRNLTVLVQKEVTSSLDRQKDGRRLPASQVQAEQNQLVQMLTARIGDVRSARRARIGWGGRGMSATTLIPRAGIADDMSRDDDARGYERDETDQFHQVLWHLVGDGDDRARAAGRQARRTLAEMDPGYERQPVLVLTRPLTFRSAGDACVLCGYWTCRCGTAAHEPGLLPVTQNTLQCDQCGGRFGFAPGIGWTCDACKAIGR
ncbi:WhiB family transcriptional regulator (plasmid) [Streptomyces sp. NBC_00464]|uniref:WhiB family transcriptional regulator n=1 Tax=Streptomyces sp. NBC_00464 TaxID=2975751 RepID=UPI002E16CD8D